MVEFDINRLELIARKYLDQAGGDRREAAHLLLQRIDSNAALKLRVMELLVEPATWDLIRQASIDPDTDTEPMQEDNQDAPSVNTIASRRQFEGHIKKMRVLPFPGADRKHDLVNRFEDLKDRVTTTLGQDCKLFQALDIAVHSRRGTDIRHALAVYESQPYVVLDRIWSTRSEI